MQPASRPPLRRLTHALTGLALLASGWCHAQTGASSAQDKQHDKQLQAIRQALLEATLETTPTQVISSSWIDSAGVLRETHEFNSKAEVRGVRLVPTEESSKTARVSVDVLPWGWRHDAKAGQGCAPAPRTWRLPLRVSSRLATGVAGPQQAASQALLKRVDQHMLAALQRSQRWTASMTAPAQPASGKTYLSTLTRAAEAPASAGWQLTLLLEALAPTPNAPVAWMENTTGVALPSVLPPAPWQWTLHLALHNTAHTAGAGARWQQDIPIRGDAERLMEHPTQWLSTVDNTLAPQLAAWVEGIDKQLQCEPTPFVVRQQGGALLLQAGQGSGLRTGDRVLLMHPGWVPSRMLDPRAADHMALAEVVRIAPQQTDLRQLAGPPLPVGSDWVALPL